MLSGGVPAFSKVRCSSFRARWRQRGSLPPGRAGWVAVGVGSQAGLLPTLCPAASPVSFPVWGLKDWDPTSQLQSHPCRRCCAPKASRGVGSGYLMAFALSGESTLQTPGFYQTPACPEAAPRDPASLTPRVLASPSSAYLGGPLAGVEEQRAVPGVRPQHIPSLPPHNAIPPNPTSPGARPLPARPSA